MTPSPAAPRAAAAALALLLAAPAAAADYTVDDPGDAPDLAIDGLCDADPGPAAACTLRAALQELEAAAAPGAIAFVAALEGATIVVGAAPLPTVTQPLVLEGPGTQGVSIIRDLASPAADGHVLRLAPPAGAQVTLRRLRLAGGWNSQAGGGLRADSGSLALEDVRLEDNRSLYGGGGLAFAGQGTLSLLRVLVSSNAASDVAGSTGGSGGGVRVDGWTGTVVTIDRSAFVGNASYGGGGALYLQAGTAVVRNSSFMENRTRTSAGAVQGGAILAWPEGGPAALTLQHVAIAGNTAGDGGGLVVTGAQPTALTLANTVLAGNGDLIGQGPDCQGNLGTTFSASHAFVGAAGDACPVADGVDGNRAGTVAAPLDARLEVVGDPGDHSRAWAPAPGSPLRDAADPGTCALPALASDQQGTSRDPGLDGDSDGTPACDVGAIEAPPPPAPVIVAFEASPAAVEAGQGVQLTWTTSGTVSCTLSDGAGAPQDVPTDDSRFVPGLAQTTTFTLTCDGVGAPVPQATASLTVTVTAAPPPAITSFTASPTEVASGGDATLTWTVTGATACTIAAGGGAPAPAVDYFLVTGLTQTTTFTLACTGPGGADTAEVTVTVASTPGTAQVTGFTATFLRLSGDPATPSAVYRLDWTTVDVSTCYLDGSLPANGSTEVALTDDRNLRLDCSGNGTASAEVFLAGPPRISTFDVPATMFVGEVATLGLTVRRVTSCELNGSPWTLGTSVNGVRDASLQVTPAETTTYTVVCTGLLGTVTASRTLTVQTTKSGGQGCSTAGGGAGLLPLALLALGLARRRRPARVP